jgi:RNA polymerase sigma factor (sigma-70 family)
VNQNYRPYYDDIILTKFRTLYPDEIENLRRETKEKHPSASRETIEKHVEHEILPAVLEEPTKNYGAGGDAVYFSTLGDMDKVNFEEIVVREESSNEQLIGHILECVEFLRPRDQQILKMSYGISPYEREFSQEEISEALGVSQPVVSIRLGRILKLLKKAA